MLEVPSGRAMYVAFEASGGFAGLNLRFSAELGELDPELAAELASLVEQSGFMELAESDVSRTPTLLPDATAYWLSVETDGRANALSVTDTTAPPGLRPLLHRLHQLALERRK